MDGLLSGKLNNHSNDKNLDFIDLIYVLQQQQQLGNSGQQWNQQAGQQQNWYNDQGYGGAFSSQSQAYDSQAKQ